mmetsp:Transcript_30075/g.75545  ORF Transcript_30075/g.75545 Transcript_30075/m.75545 type:complete len:220 (+) Transcript_30075:261-920(+)
MPGIHLRGGLLAAGARTRGAQRGAARGAHSSAWHEPAWHALPAKAAQPPQLRVHRQWGFAADWAGISTVLPRLVGAADRQGRHARVRRRARRRLPRVRLHCRRARSLPLRPHVHGWHNRLPLCRHVREGALSHLPRRRYVVHLRADAYRAAGLHHRRGQACHGCVQPLFFRRSEGRPEKAARILPGRGRLLGFGRALLHHHLHRAGRRRVQHECAWKPF